MVIGILALVLRTVVASVAVHICLVLVVCHVVRVLVAVALRTIVLLEFVGTGIAAVVHRPIVI